MILHPYQQKILQILFEAHAREQSQALGTEELAHQIGVSWEEIRHEVGYLAEKEYIILKSRQIRTRIFHTAYITAKGIDLLQSRITEGWDETQPKSTGYNLKNIRALLNEGFTDEELRRFCYDEPAFRPVYDQLAQETGKAKIIDRLLEYSERKLKLDRLLTLTKEHNFAQYEKHQPYCDADLS